MFQCPADYKAVLIDAKVLDCIKVQERSWEFMTMFWTIQNGLDHSFIKMSWNLELFDNRANMILYKQYLMICYLNVIGKSA